MKKHLFWALTALVTLGACSKSENNPAPNPAENQPVKKIKEVQTTFLDQETNSNYEQKNEAPYLYTLTNWTTSYEYDAEGRISKITNKEEGLTFRVFESSYPHGKMVFKSEGKESEVPHNSKGYLNNTPSNYYFYNDNGQLNKVGRETLSWENGNLTQIDAVFGMQNNISTTKFTYYSNENKNKFFIFNLEGNWVATYLSYFDLQKALPIGVPTKNLVKTIVRTFEHKNSPIGTTSITSSFDYTYDADGYVTSIIENEKGNDGVRGSGGAASNSEVEKLEQLMADIDNGTIKNKTYKIHQNANGVYHFEFTQNFHITKDTNGKAIDVKYSTLETYKYLYTETNGVRNYTSYEETYLNNREASTSHKIIYE